MSTKENDTRWSSVTIERGILTLSDCEKEQSVLLSEVIGVTCRKDLFTYLLVRLRSGVLIQFNIFEPADRREATRKILEALRMEGE